ncbi:MAG: hypothetical protein ACR2OW_00245 [Methyloligellaceae bacterium]
MRIIKKILIVTPCLFVLSIGPHTSSFAAECRSHSANGFGMTEKMAEGIAKWNLSNSITSWAKGKARISKIGTKCQKTDSLFKLIYKCEAQTRACKGKEAARATKTVNKETKTSLQLDKKHSPDSVPTDSSLTTDRSLRLAKVTQDPSLATCGELYEAWAYSYLAASVLKVEHGAEKERFKASYPVLGQEFNSRCRSEDQQQIANRETPY